MFGRKKTYVALYEYEDEKGGYHIDYKVMRRSQPPKPEEFILRREPTGKILIFEAKVVHCRPFKPISIRCFNEST